MLDSRIYVVEFPDGEQQDVSFNTIAEHLFAQVDSEGNLTRIFKRIVGHQKHPRAINKEDQFRVVNGQRTKKKTTTGWDIEIEWRDGSTSWLPMKEVKATNSVELAKYAVENWIDDEPAFDWWVKPTLWHWKRLIKLSQKRHSVMGYKFGIRVPRTIEEALKLDEENGNDLWRKAIQREMEKVRVAFQLLERGAAPPPGHQFIKLHMIFDIKMDLQGRQD